MAQVRHKFIASDITSIAVNSNGTFTAVAQDVGDVDQVALQGYATGGNASCSLDVIFKLIGCLDGTLWDTVPFGEFRVTLNGTTQVVKSDQLDVRGYRQIKLLSIFNSETQTGYTATAVNLLLGKSYLT